MDHPLCRMAFSFWSRGMPCSRMVATTLSALAWPIGLLPARWFLREDTTGLPRGPRSAWPPTSRLNPISPPSGSACPTLPGEEVLPHLAPRASSRLWVRFQAPGWIGPLPLKVGVFAEVLGSEGGVGLRPGSLGVLLRGGFYSPRPNSPSRCHKRWRSRPVGLHPGVYTCGNGGGREVGRSHGCLRGGRPKEKDNFG
jgi:hypothetical protein